MITQWENKAMPYINITNKSGVRLHGLKPDETLKIEVDKNGTPKLQEWRRRFKDARVDGCIEIESEMDIEQENE